MWYYIYNMSLHTEFKNMTIDSDEEDYQVTINTPKKREYTKKPGMFCEEMPESIITKNERNLVSYQERMRRNQYTDELRQQARQQQKVITAQSILKREARMQYAARVAKRQETERVVEGAVGAQPIHKDYTVPIYKPEPKSERLGESTDPHLAGDIQDKNKKKEIIGYKTIVNKKPFCLNRASCTPAVLPNSNMTIEERLTQLNKRTHRRCIHKNRFTTLIVYKKNGNPFFYEPGCECAYVSFNNSEKTTERCLCTAFWYRVEESSNNQCRCTLYHCFAALCKRSMYHFNGSRASYCLCRDLITVENDVLSGDYFDFNNKLRFGQLQRSFATDRNKVVGDFSYAMAANIDIKDPTDPFEYEGTTDELYDWYQTHVINKPFTYTNLLQPGQKLPTPRPQNLGRPVAQSDEQIKFMPNDSDDDNKQEVVSNKAKTGNIFKQASNKLKNAFGKQLSETAQLESCARTIDAVGGQGVKLNVFGARFSDNSRPSKVAKFLTAPLAIGDAIGVGIKESLKKVVNSLETAIGDFIHEKLATKLKEKYPRIYKIYEFLKSGYELLKEILDMELHKIVNLGGSILAIIKAQSFTDVLLAISAMYGAFYGTQFYTRICVILGMDRELIHKLCKMSHDELECLIKVDAYIGGMSVRIMRDMYKLRGQSGVFDTCLRDIGSYFGLAGKALGKFILMMGPKAQAFNNVYNLAKNFGGILKAFISILPFSIKKYISVVDPDSYIKESTKDKNSNFCKLVKLTYVYHESIYLDTGLGAEARLAAHKKAAMAQYKVVSAEMQEIGLTESTSRVMSNLFKICNRPAQPVMGLEATESCVFTLKGGAGSGKTTFSKILASKLLGVPLDKVSKYIYVRNSNDEYWSGYRPDVHHVVIFDDFGQDTDEYKDFKELIALMSMANFMPSMPTLDDADVGLKGTIVAPKILILCTNLTDISSVKGVYKLAAVKRRFGFVCEMERKQARGLKQDSETSITTVTVAKRAPDFSDVDFKIVKTGHNDKTVTAKEVCDMAADYFDQFLESKDQLKEHMEEFVSKAGQTFINNKDADRAKRLGLEIESQGLMEYSDEVVIVSQLLSLPLFIAAGFTYSEKKFIPKVLMITSVAIGGLGILYSAFKLYNKYKSTPEAQSRSANLKSTMKIKSQGEWLDFSFEPDTEVKSQAESVSQIPEIVRNNTFQVILNGEITKRRVHGLFIKGTIALINTHFFSSSATKDEIIEEGTEIQLQSNNNTTKEFETFFFVKNNLYMIPDTDLALYDFGYKTTQSRRSIIQHFTSNNIYAETPIRLSLDREAGKEWNTTKISRIMTTLEYDTSLKPVLVKYAFQYPCRTIDGDCGTPILSDGPEPKIIGIHCAGVPAKQMAYAKMITRNLLEKYLGNFKSIRELEEPNIPMTVIQAQSATEEYGIGPNFTNIVGVIPKVMVHSSSKTALRLSPYAECLGEVKYFPANLDQKLITPGINKYSNNALRLDPAMRKKCVDNLVELYTSYNSPTPWRRLTTFEAINGVQGNKYLRPLDFTTGPGAPFNYMGYSGEKRQLFDVVSVQGENVLYKPNAMLERMLDQFEEKLHNKIIPFVPYTGTLKDETRLEEKVNKPRLFSQGSVLATITGRKYYGAFISHMTYGSPYNETALALDPYSVQYDALIKYILEVGQDYYKTVDTTDTDKWDGSMLLDVMWDSNEVIQRVYQFFGYTDDFEILDTLLCYEAYALHITTVFNLRTSKFDTVFWITRGGMPSGTLMTIYRNCLVNQLYSRIAWIGLAPPQYSSMFHFTKHVRLVTCGDDKLKNKTQVCMSFYNSKAIADFMLKFGVKLVNADDKNLPPVDCTMSEASFIKVKPAKKNGKYMARLDYDTIMNIINWYKDSLGPDLAFEVNANTILRFMYFYGPKEFERIRSTLFKTRPCTLLEYDYLDMLYNQQGRLGFDFSRTTNDKLAFPTKLEDLDSSLNTESIYYKMADSIKAQSAEGLNGIIDKIQTSILPLAMMADTFGGLLDKPAISDNPKPVYIRDGQFHGLVRGTEWNIENLGPADPAAMSLVDLEHTGTTEDEMSIMSLVKRKCLLDTISWDTTQAEGTRMITYIVSPTHNNVNLGSTGHGLMTLLYSVSQNALFWRGSLVITADFVCSNWQEGRVDFVYQPNQSQPSTDYKTALSQYAISYTLRNGKNIVELNIPYIGVQPWRRVWHGELLQDDPTTDAYKASDFISGVFSLYVSVPLKAPATVVNNMNINLFISAGPDFELSYFGQAGISRVFVPYPHSGKKDKKKPSFRIKAQSEETKGWAQQMDEYDANNPTEGTQAETIVETAEDSERPVMETPVAAKSKPIAPTVKQTNKAPANKIKTKASSVSSIDPNTISVLGPGDKAATLAPKKMFIGDPKNPHFGESYKSLREICKRYKPVIRFVFGQSHMAGFSDAVKNGINPLIIDYLPGDFTNEPYGMMSFCGHLFRNWRGSINYKVRVRPMQVYMIGQNFRVQIMDSQYTTSGTPTNDPATFDGTIVSDGTVLTNVYDSGQSSAIAYGNACEWIEFKLQFITPHASKIIAHDEIAGQYFENFAGLPGFRIGITGPIGDLSYLTVEVYAGLGDETRMWNFHMIPWSAQINTAPSYPDSWLPTEEDDFVKIKAQSSEQSNISENTLNMRQVGGVGLMEQNRPIVIDRPMNTVYNSRAHAENQDIVFNLPQMLSRQNLVGSVQWSQSTNVDTLLSLNGNSATDIVSDLLQSDIMSIPYTRFAFWRCSYINLHFQLTASRYHQGRVIAAFVPSQVPANTVRERVTAARLVANDHVMFDPTNGTVATLRIPFKHYKGYLDLLNKDCLGQVYFVVLNKLQAVAGSADQVTIKVFASIEDSEFTTPRPGGTSLSQYMSQRK